MIFCNGRTLPSQVEAIIHGSFLSTVHMISEMVHHFGNPEGNGYEYVADLHSDQVFYTLGFLKDSKLYLDGTIMVGLPCPKAESEDERLQTAATLNLVGFYQKKGTDDGSEHQD